jgi:hypothetical protein
MYLDLVGQPSPPQLLKKQKTVAELNVELAVIAAQAAKAAAEKDDVAGGGNADGCKAGGKAVGKVDSKAGPMVCLDDDDESEDVDDVKSGGISQFSKSLMKRFPQIHTTGCFIFVDANTGEIMVASVFLNEKFNVIFRGDDIDADESSVDITMSGVDVN